MWNENKLKKMQDFKAGHYVNQGHYKSFQPNDINRQWSVNDMGL